MTTTDLDLNRRPGGGQAVRLGLGVAAPLAILGLAYGLWWTSDHLLWIGPLDRAAFSWLVVVPVWASAPIAAGFAWSRLSPRGTTVASLIVGCATAAIAALLFWLAVAHPDCQFGATRSPAEWVLPSLIAGTAMGAGPAVSGLLAVTSVRMGHPWRAALVGFLTQAAFVFVAIVVAVTVLLSGGGGCNRPV